MLFRTPSKYIKKKRMTEADGNLQITALADILIVMLIFLIKSFASGMTEAENLSVSNKIHLPSAFAEGQALQGVKVEIAADFVEVAGERVSQLQDFRFLPQDLNADLEDNGTSRSLSSYFVKQRKEANIKEMPSTVWIIADQKAPYATIQTVIASAAYSGFQDFKLAVEKKE